MKKRVKLKRKTVSLIVKNLIVLVALAAVALAAVFSWFTDHPEVDSSGVNATVEIDQSLEYFIVSPEFTTASHVDDNDNPIDAYHAIKKQLAENALWNSSHPSETQKIDAWRNGAINLDPDENPELSFLNDLALCDITSSGSVFKIPKLIQHQHITYVDQDAAFSDAEPNKQYLSFDIYFRCPISCTVVMKDASTIEPTGTPSNSSEQGVKNAAIGAVRLSAVNDAGTTKFIWIPAPDLWYDGRNDPGTLYTSLDDIEDLRDRGTNAGGNVTSDGHTISLTSETTKDHAYYSQTSTTQNDTTVYTTTRNVMDSSAANSIVRPSVDGDYQLPGDEALVTLATLDDNGTVSNTSDDYYYGYIRINLWIEGEDAEARLAMVHGMFNMDLVFDAIANQS